MSDTSAQNLHPKPNSASGVLDYSAPDLTKYPPRSPRTRIGGFVHLARMIDKARATVAGTNGEYHYDCPMDQRFFEFTGVKAADFLLEVKAGKGDGELLDWVVAHLQPKRTDAEIVAWSAWYEQRVPTGVDGREFFNGVHKKNAPKREDIATWFDWLELDDFVTFGGKP
jgi:hypothetical protein